MHNQITNYALLKELLKNIPDDDSCMEWPRRLMKPGSYARITVSNKEVLVHRAAYALVAGEIPEGLKVLHRCDNPPCFRPSHLFTGTQDENMKDCAVKGRIVNQLKLTPEKVREIRRLRSEGVIQPELARMFNVSHATISFIVRRKTWRKC